MLVQLLVQEMIQLTGYLVCHIVEISVKKLVTWALIIACRLLDLPQSQTLAAWLRVELGDLLLLHVRLYARQTVQGIQLFLSAASRSLA